MVQWKIQGVELPVNPQFAEFRTSRPPNVAPTIMGFPLPISSSVSSIHLIIKGYIWPQGSARQLREIVKNAGEMYVDVTEPEGIYSGTYTVTKGAVIQSSTVVRGPSESLVYKYEIDFVTGADMGAAQNSVVAGIEAGEMGVGNGGFVEDDFNMEWVASWKEAGKPLTIDELLTLHTAEVGDN